MPESRWLKVKESFNSKSSQESAHLFTDLVIKDTANPLRQKLQADISNQINIINGFGAINHKRLLRLIDSANTFIESIPKEDRSSFIFNTGMVNRFNSPDATEKIQYFNTKYPNAAEIFTLLKRAVTLSYLPEASTLASANWKKLNEVLEIQGTGKRLQESYWAERGFKGKLDIRRWVNDDGAQAMLSLNEQQEKATQERGLNVKRVYYPTSEDKECFQVHFANQKFKNQNGELLNSTFVDPETQTPMRLTNITAEQTLFAFTGKELFVLDKKLAAEHPDHLFHHSSLAGGVRAIAGTMVIENGNLSMITNDSGHYQPTAKDLVSVIQFMKAQGADLSHTKVSIKTMEDYLLAALE